MALVNTVGPPVEGEDRFWNREVDLRLLTARLDEGNHVLLVAQRRMGKTSILREIARRLRDRYTCLFVDVQKHESPADVIAAIGGATRQHANIWQRTKATFGNIVKAAGDKIDSLQISEVTVHLRAGMAGDDWRAKGDALFEALAQVDSGTILMLDEVPILINRMLKGEDHEIQAEGRREAELFLSWLRENALRYAGRVRLVVSGSIGLTPVLHRAGLSATANYLMPFELSPWDKDTAVGFIRALAESYGLDVSVETCGYMVERIGCCIPHHVQTYFSLAVTYCRRNDKAEFSQADAEEVYLHDMLGPRGNTELAHYEERLLMVLGRELGTLAVGILTETAVTGSLAPQAAHAIAAEYAADATAPEKSLRIVLGVLEHDGYLRKERNQYEFVSRLLRDWWRDRFASPYAKPERREKT
jgi:hypothetical protein